MLSPPQSSLADLVRKALRLPVAVGGSLTSSRELTSLWNQIELAAAQGYTLKETDTVFSVVLRVIKLGYPPEKLETWSSLARHLLVYGEVESQAVLHYPGRVEEKAESLLAAKEDPVNSTPEMVRQRYHMYPSRELLLLTGGVVPLSARSPCSSGVTLASFLSAYCTALRSKWIAKSTSLLKLTTSAVESTAVAAQVESSVASVVDLTLQSFSQGGAVQYSVVEGAVTDLMRLLLESAVMRTVNGSSVHLSNSGDSSTLETERDVKGACASFVEGMDHLCHLSEQKGVGIALALNLVSSPSLHQWLVLQDSPFVEEGTSAQGVVKVFLEVLKGVLQAVKQHHRLIPVDTSAMLLRVLEVVDVILQANANRLNVLRVSEQEAKALRMLVMERVVTAMRLEAVSPDVFLQESMEWVERCPPSMSIEAELLTAKAELLEVFDLDEERRQLVYDDLIQSLRRLVALRPQGEDELETDEEVSPDRAVSDIMEGSQSRLDPYSQHLMQSTHELVLTALCGSDSEKYLNEAYNVVVSHKYHGLIVTKEIIRPLLAKFARRGDGRNFNLADLCVLYSNCVVDMEVIAALFRTCALNGDVYRAQSLLNILKSIVPGFMVKASDDVINSLRTLHILSHEPLHLFVSDEDIAIYEALGQKREDTPNLLKEPQAAAAPPSEKKGK